MSSYEDASKIVNAYAEQAEKIREEAKTLPAIKATQFSTGIKFSSADKQGFLPVPKQEEGPIYVHTVPTIWNDGPNVPTTFEIETKGFVEHIRAEHPVERAGGYRSVIACQRALQEAMQGLFHGS